MSLSIEAQVSLALERPRQQSHRCRDQEFEQASRILNTFNKILNSTRTTDGYAILYKLIESQHPNLTSEQKKPAKPTIDQNNCIYDFITEYENWLDYESISSCTYTPAEKVEYLLEQLQQDDKYEEAYKLVSSQ